jgi:hypothetical protein
MLTTDYLIVIVIVGVAGVDKCRRRGGRRSGSLLQGVNISSVLFVRRFVGG